MWKELGYQVQKGEKAKAQIIIWKFVSSKKEESDEEPNSKMFMKKASFFTQAQVKAI